MTRFLVSIVSALVLALVAIISAVPVSVLAQFDQQPEIVAYENLVAEQYIVVSIVDDPSAARNVRTLRGDQVEEAFGGIVLAEDDMPVSLRRDLGIDAGRAFVMRLDLGPAMLVALAIDDHVVLIMFIGEDWSTDEQGRFTLDVIDDGLDAEPPFGFFPVDNDAHDL